MFKTTLLLAYRNLMKDKGFTFINIIGLALGLACFILIMVYVIHEIYLYNIFQLEIGTPGTKAIIHTTIIIASVILFLSCINFIAFSTTRFSNNIKKTSVLKNGRFSRSTLFVQFMIESFILMVIVIIIAFVLVAFTIKPFFNTIQLEYIILFYKTPYFYSCIISFFLLVGFLSGVYPALIMWSANNTNGLRGKLITSPRGAFLRKSLVVLQFCMLFFILLGALVINCQLSFLQEDNKGFTSKNLIVLHNTSDIKNEKRKMLKDEILKIPGVLHASYTNYYPLENNANMNIWDENDSSKTTFNLANGESDGDYKATMGLTVLKGRYFDKNIKHDSANILLNETAVKTLGFKNPIGKRMVTFVENKDEKLLSGTKANQPKAYKYMTIIGVIKDFNVDPKQQEIRPLIFSLQTQDFNYMLVKFEDGRKDEALQKISELWKSVSEGSSLYSEDIQEKLDWHYRNVISSTKIIGIFSIICIFIACIGLLGLLSYSAFRRSKEIVFHKANGSEAWHVLFSLSKDTMMLITIAIIIAIPISYFTINLWLNQFASHITITISHIILTIISLYLIAILSDVSLTFKAARQNPIKALRN